MKARAALRALAMIVLCAAPLAALAHDFRLTDLQGKQHTLAVHKGKWVVLNVWATWCAPCITEMPELDALARARPDVVVLGLAADGENPARIGQFATALRVAYPIIAGNRALMADFKIRAYPTTMLYDPSGALVLTRLGQVTRRDLEQHLPQAAR